MRAEIFKRLFESYEILSDQHALPTKKGISFAAEAIRSALLEAGMDKDKHRRVKRTYKKLSR